ncbi:unnamed protein product [Allacma fusca]|uniref:Uncharacterized protein n=1 Tax=Allacma fusca TaxID=39272 RepID=A0A8J2K5D1_9HEXA|nr:unnamed protein product [Allacma fusca]
MSSRTIDCTYFFNTTWQFLLKRVPEFCQNPSVQFLPGAPDLFNQVHSSKQRRQTADVTRGFLAARKDAANSLLGFKHSRVLGKVQEFQVNSLKDQGQSDTNIHNFNAKSQMSG